MAQRIRAFDWSKTPIGAMESWSPALRMMVRFLLANRFPLLLWWGPRYVSLYNDPYVPILGAKHPWALGQPVSECWREIWPILQPLIDTPYHGGPATWNEDLFLEIHRKGFFEETHFTIAYSPVPDETVPGGIGGVLATVHEITEKVVAERRVMALRDLGADGVQAKTAEEACAKAVATLSSHSKDVPFALLYLIVPDGQRASLACAAGIPEGSPARPDVVDLGSQATGAPIWPLAEAMETGTMQVLEDLPARLGDAVPAGPWTDPPWKAVVVPIRSNAPQQMAGVLVAGVSARLQLDELYRSFLELVAGQVATAIANARAFEEEMKRAEDLAALDRAKTAFFSNVSHEFRTPLTLMLGPVEEMLAKGGADLGPTAKGQLEVVRRNSLRLLKLVNTMLDFSCIEAGRIKACYRQMDLASYTAEVASNFRSACERAGLRLVIDCPPLPPERPVYVDRDMWEKIILNLLSNAFKFTHEGEIGVRVEAEDGRVRLTVSDTGVGIPSEELTRVFERFHRVRDTRGRTHEGTGIGLSLVQELVKLHGGTVVAQSVLGEGSRFIVTLPVGSSHLDPQRVRSAPETASTETRSEAFVEEALRWLHDPSWPSSSDDAPHDGRRARILWADDNADMRDYVRRLLGKRFDVQAVPDGKAALASARADPPDLVLSDVMMPGMDGFALLRELRADPRLCEIPIVLLSARAGEESRVEGMEAGADDYLVKPFSERELMARVETHVKMSRMRSETKAALREADRRKDDFLATLAHELRNPLAPIRHAAHLLKMAGSESELGRRALQTIERQMKQTVRIVDDLMDISRISRDKLELRRESTELSAIVESAVETSRPIIEAARQDLSVSPERDAIWLEADPTRMTQVLANLLNNASKFTPEGGRIWLTTERHGDEAIVRVRDSGIGIQPEALPYIFDMFRQADTTGDRSRGGLGIGLTLVRRIVELHGGSVGAASEGLGRGSEFTVRLPVAPSPRARKAREPKEVGTTIPRSARRILVVDDNRDAAESLGALLKAMGNDVRIVHDGLTALEEARRIRPDFAFLDIGMPGMDGYEVATRLRGQSGLEGLVLVAMTGWGKEEDRRRSRQAGFDEHLTKPADPAVLEDLLAQRRQRRLTGL